MSPASSDIFSCSLITVLSLSPTRKCDTRSAQRFCAIPPWPCSHDFPFSLEDSPAPFSLVGSSPLSCKAQFKLASVVSLAPPRPEARLTPVAQNPHYPTHLAITKSAQQFLSFSICLFSPGPTPKFLAVKGHKSLFLFPHVATFPNIFPQLRALTFCSPYLSILFYIFFNVSL